jgi:iduronate 2-sulfatase
MSRTSSRRQFLGQIAAATIGTAVADKLHAQAAPPPRRRPNMLFLMSDDMRVELGCYASMFGAKTPNLDALAGAGVRFDRNYCQFPLCNPSRSSLLTGKNPTRTSVLGNRTYFRDAHPDWTTLPQVFTRNGYVTVRAGKIYHGGIDDAPSWSATSDAAPGEDVTNRQVGRTMQIPRKQIPMPDGELPPLPADNSRAAYSDRIVLLDGNGEGHGDYLTADHTIANLRKYKNQPFFIACGFVKPHSPPTAPQKFFDLYDPEKIKLTPDFAAWPTVPKGFPSAAIRRRNADLFIGRGASEEEARQVIRAYLASISWTDWNIGRVIGELDRLGLRDNTIIVFLADHGYQLGEKGKWSKAGSLFEMGTRVPLIIHAPGMAGNGKSSTRIVQSLDLYATLVELCGLDLPPGNEGTSIASLLAKPDAPWPKPAYSVWSEDGATLHGVAVRTEEFRYAEFGPNGVNGAMLLDPKSDPLELKNLANDPKYADACADLSKLAQAYAATLDT